MAAIRRRSVDSTSTWRSAEGSLLGLAPSSIRRRGTLTGNPLSPIHSRVDVTEPQMPPLHRFRSAVRKIIVLNRLATGIEMIGGEPGVDPRRAAVQLAYEHIQQECLIEIVDYSSVRHTSRRMNNEDFVNFIQDAKLSVRDAWAKVRWINVGGLSWDIISALAIKYDLHPLSIEDILQTRKHARSKADYYIQHLFIRVLCHALGSEDSPEGEEEYTLSSPTEIHQFEPLSIGQDEEAGTAKWNTQDDDRTLYASRSTSRFNFRSCAFWKGSRRGPGSLADLMFARTPLRRVATFNADIKSRKDARNLKVIQELLKGQRVDVRVTPMCIFLLRDGKYTGLFFSYRFTAPISERLLQKTSGLRSRADASLLVQGLLDLVVDQAMEVVEEYQSKILKLEQAVLMKPQMKHVVRLHALQEDLILHRRTLEPIKTLVYTLRRYDVDRVAALYSDRPISMQNIQGYMSHRARVYLADVHDHMEYILTTLEMFSHVSENLIDYTFNMSSYEMSEVMRRLTLATVIFLPLTVLAGYFGMNFSSMWSTYHNHTDVIYWIIALPMLAILLPIFLWSDLARMKEGLEKRMAARAVKQQYKSLRS
ncbi:hypothetical protein NM688_g2080 [Phlebia brevispora]|uniref:Uncharacterized protein n=1 Tax=Phlebia brevispora TaxID=194682 RepID=A0ACC1T9P6_9APHY|nr:hypothetical protein NM688_g2080 [Phlebia brevispora]